MEAENGNKYLLALEDDKWTAVFQMADAISVMLGDHGGTAMITKAEDGTYWIGEMEIESGGMVTGDNGQMYTLTMDDEGMWIGHVEHAGCECMVTLGENGGTKIDYSEARGQTAGGTAKHRVRHRRRSTC